VAFSESVGTSAAGQKVKIGDDRWSCDCKAYCLGMGVGASLVVDLYFTHGRIESVCVIDRNSKPTI
jgi:hypothetical protein